MVKVASNRRGAVNVKLACHSAVWQSVEQCATVWRRVTVGQSRRAILTNCYRHFSPVSCSRNWYESLLSSAHMYKCASHRQQRAFSVESPVILTNYCQSQPSQVIIGTVTATWWSSSFHSHALGAAIIAATWPGPDLWHIFVNFSQAKILNAVVITFVTRIISTWQEVLFLPKICTSWALEVCLACCQLVCGSNFIVHSEKTLTKPNRRPSIPSVPSVPVPSDCDYE